MSFQQVINTISIAFIPFMLGMIMHEVAHGWMAYKMGDPTAKKLGRLTLNPVKHLDPMGTAVFVLTAVASAASPFPFVLGWAKPVPINPRLFRNARKGMFLVSIAGAATNFLLALGFAGLLRLYFMLTYNPDISPLIHLSNGFIVNVCVLGIIINCTLGFFNLLPIPPLDGSKVLASVMPVSIANQYLSLGRFGMFIVIALLALGFFNRFILPLILRSTEFILNLAGLSLF